MVVFVFVVVFVVEVVRNAFVCDWEYLHPAQLKTLVKSSQLSSFLSHPRPSHSYHSHHLYHSYHPPNFLWFAGALFNEILSISFEISSYSCCLQGRNPSCLQQMQICSTSRRLINFGKSFPFMGLTAIFTTTCIQSSEYQVYEGGCVSA